MVSQSRIRGPHPLNSQSALLALEELIRSLAGCRRHRVSNPLVLCGRRPAVLARYVGLLTQGLACCAPSLEVTVLPARDIVKRLDWCNFAGSGSPLSTDAVSRVGLWVIEDMQRLPAAEAETLVQFVDANVVHNTPMVFTMSVAPNCLRLPARLVSRLSAGLVVEADGPLAAPLGTPPSRAPDRVMNRARSHRTPSAATTPTDTPGRPGPGRRSA
jgi:hypothetical protein